MKNYINYHLHSDYSLLDSCTDFRLYVDRACELGQTAVASTEHGKPLGWVAKKLYCAEKGLKFIHGVEIYLTESHEEKVRDNYHTILLARNHQGLLELNRLVSMSCEEDHFYYVNRLSFDEFLGISDNIIKTSACLASPLNKLPHDHPRYYELAQHYDFLEIQPHIHPEQVEYNKWLYELSKDVGVPLIAATDTHSLNQYKAECRAILLEAKHKSYGNEDSFDLTYRDYDTLVKDFRVQGALPEEVYTEAIERTNELNELCESYEVDRSIKYPILYGSQQADEEKFEEVVWESLDAKVADGTIPEEQEAPFREAITEELRVFKKLHMGGFMLSMSEFIRWCKSQGFSIGPARGSVGGCRCAYVTDIIDLNPEQWHTVFSRFANEDREEIGDIDIDCIEEDRPAIFRYITERFGRDRTARVGAYGTLADKSVIEEIGRGLRGKNEEKYSIKNIDRIKKEYEKDPESTRTNHPDIFYYYDGLVGTRVSQSVHPAGIVISPISLDDNFGVFDKDGEHCLMLDMDDAHEVGLAKYDFLILKNIQIIRDTCRLAGVPYPKSCDVDFDDPEVWDDMLRSPTGIFQMEGDYAFSLLKKFKPRSIFDMSLVTACIRPSGASYRDALISKKPHHNPSEIIDDLLAENNGYLVYQEDTIKFLQQICGLSGSEADNIRRAIGRKQKDRLEKALPAILDGYCSKSDKPREEAEAEAKEFLQILEDSASYQFGYNHSVAYCIVGYYCAYFRHKYPLEFITAYLNNAANESDIRNGTELAKVYGLKVENPKWGISRSDYFYNKEKRAIAKGLSSVKYIGESVADELYKLSQSKTYTHFCDLVLDLINNTAINTRQLDILVKIDFFSEFGNQRELLRIIDLCEMFKWGDAKQIKKTLITDERMDAIIARYSVGVTKSGGVAKSYTLLDVPPILRELEDLVKSVGMSDLEDIVKIRNYKDIMGYIGYTSGKEEDRRKLFITGIKPIYRKKDGKQWAYSIFTKSIGSGVEARFTTLNYVYNRDPVQENDIIYCRAFERDGPYYKLTDYSRII